MPQMATAENAEATQPVGEHNPLQNHNAAALMSQSQPLAAEPASVTAAPVSLAEDVEDNQGGYPQEPLQPHTWWQWVSHLRLAGLTMAIARNSALVSVRGDDYEFDVDPVQGALFNDSQAHKIQQAMREIFPQARVTMALQSPRGETPEQRRQRQQEEARYGAKQAIEGDPLVQRLLSEFGGVVVDETIRPVS